MSENLALQKIAPLIHQIHGQRVILDSDLARIYGVSVKALNQAIKRNAERFPEDFAFQLNGVEWQRLRSQIVTSSSRSPIATLKTHGGRRYSPHVFTEHGALMAANVLHSEQAVEMSVFVVRTFVKLRETLLGNKELSAKIDELDRRVGSHDKAIASIIAAIRQLTAPTVRKPRAIGFRIKRINEKNSKRSHHAGKK